MSFAPCTNISKAFLPSAALDIEATLKLIEPNVTLEFVVALLTVEGSSQSKSKKCRF